MDDEYDSPWSTYGQEQNIPDLIGISLGGENGNFDPSKSFLENGGDSLTAIATMMQLHQAGHQITVEQFLGGGTIKDLAKAQFAAALEGMSNNLTFTQKDLKELSADEAQLLIAECFSAKGDLENSGDPPLVIEDFVPFLKRFWPKLENLSFGLVNEKNQIRAIATLADKKDLSTLCMDGLNSSQRGIDIMNYLHFITERVEERLGGASVGKGIVLSKFMLATSLKNTPTENVYLMYLMAKGIHERAKAEGFQMSYAQNTSPATQQLAEFFGCERLLINKPQDWTNDKGENPFLRFPAAQFVTVDLKDYSKTDTLSIQ